MWQPGEKKPPCDVLILPERTAPKTHHPRTVRWVLLHGGSRNRGDRIYTWSTAYADAPVLQIPAYDFTELNDPGLPRHGTAVWVGKGTAGILPADARVITYSTPRPELIDILKTSRSLLSFDAFSAVNTEATLCGTPVHLPIGRPIRMPDGDDCGFRWADVDNSHLLPQARSKAATDSTVALASVDDFERAMLEWM